MITGNFGIKPTLPGNKPIFPSFLFLLWQFYIKNYRMHYLGSTSSLIALLCPWVKCFILLSLLGGIKQAKNKLGKSQRYKQSENLKMEWTTSK